MKKRQNKNNNDVDNLQDWIYTRVRDTQMKSVDDIKFAIIGNPPYQGKEQGGSDSCRSASAVWDKFMLPFYKIDKIYEMCVIFPSRFLFGTGKGVREFFEKFKKGQYVKDMIIYPRSTEVFPDVKIDGGVCIVYFNKDVNTNPNINNSIYIESRFGNYTEKTYRPILENGRDTFILYYKLNNFLNKIYSKKNSFRSIVGSRGLYGFTSNFYDYVNHSFKPTDHCNLGVYSYLKKESRRLYMYVNLDDCKEASKKFTKKFNFEDSNVEYFNKNINKYKVCISKTKNPSLKIENFPMYDFFREPFIIEPGKVHTETYLSIPVDSKEIADNVISYMKTKFFQALISTKAVTRNLCKDSFEYIPLQDFTQSWSDDKLYNIYKPLFGETEYKEIWDFINFIVR